MSFLATVYKVFIASPSDVAAERQVARRVIFEWNDLHAEHEKVVALPIGWETHSYPASGNHPQKIIDAQALEGCDLLVGIFWARLGEKTPDADSGTVEEIERHIASGKQAMIYFSKAPLPQTHDPKQFAKVQKFEALVRSRVRYDSFSTIEGFEKSLKDHLVQALRSFAKDGTRPIPVAAPITSASLSADAKKVLLRATEPGSTSSIMYGNLYPSQVWFVVDGQQFVENDGKDLKDILRWKSVLDELYEKGLIDLEAENTNIIQATPTLKGIELAEQLRKDDRDAVIARLDCPVCQKTRENTETDPKKPPVLRCRNPRCLDSTWHAGTECPSCKGKPAKILTQGVGFTEFICGNGHRFIERAGVKK